MFVHCAGGGFCCSVVKSSNSMYDIVFIHWKDLTACMPEKCVLRVKVEKVTVGKFLHAI